MLLSWFELLFLIPGPAAYAKYVTRAEIVTLTVCIISRVYTFRETLNY